MQMICGDALEKLKAIPDGSVDMVLTDPPYNIGKAEWDKIPNYVQWCVTWLKECGRCLKPNGVLYFWHNNVSLIAELLCAMHGQTELVLQSFCVWDKSENYRFRTWANRDPDGAFAPRSWFNTCEYCLHFFNTPPNTNTPQNRDRKHSVLDSNPECYRPLKEWYASEKARLNLTDKDIARKYTAAVGKKPYMIRHYFKDSQFLIPTCTVWDRVYRPLGFDRRYDDLRNDYELLRNYHRCDPAHNNVWRRGQMQRAEKHTGHPCEKPVDLLRRIVRVSCPPGGTVLDCFMGSGSTGVAAIKEGRDFIGIEKDENYFNLACDWIRRERAS